MNGSKLIWKNISQIPSPFRINNVKMMIPTKGSSTPKNKTFSIPGERGLSSNSLLVPKELEGEDTTVCNMHEKIEDKIRNDENYSVIIVRDGRNPKDICR